MPLVEETLGLGIPWKAMPLLAPPCPDPVSMTRTVYQSLNGLLNKDLNEKHTETN